MPSFGKKKRATATRGASKSPQKAKAEKEADSPVGEVLVTTTAEEGTEERAKENGEKNEAEGTNFTTIPVSKPTEDEKEGKVLQEEDEQEFETEERDVFDREEFFDDDEFLEPEEPELDGPWKTRQISAPKIAGAEKAGVPSMGGNRHMEASRRTRPVIPLTRGPIQRQKPGSRQIKRPRMLYEDEEDDDFLFDDDEYERKGKGRSIRSSRVVHLMEEANFDADEERKFAENGCPVYCSMSMTLSLAQQLVFKEDKALERICSKVPDSYAGKCSVYLINLQEAEGVNCYSDLATDLYGTWGGCKRRYIYFKYLDDGSVQRVEGGSKTQERDWDFSIQENTYQHPYTKQLQSHMKKKIFTVRYNGKAGEIVKTWAIIAYEWSEEPLDIEFPAVEVSKRPKQRGAPIVGEGGLVRGTDSDDDADDDDGAVKYSGNGCPVYSSKSISHKLAEEIIFDPDKRMDLVCDKVPSGYVGRKSIYLIDLQKTLNVNVFGDLTVDSYGSWGNGNAKCWYYRYGDDDTVERIAPMRNGTRPAPDVKWDFILQENRYPCHPQTKDLPSQFKRRVYTIRDKRAPSEIVKTWAVIGYYWSDEPLPFTVAPHGNCKKAHRLSAGYQRTRPTVRKILEEKLQAGYTPKEVFASAHEELGGIVGADTAADLPSTPIQVYNLARHLRKNNLLPTPKEMRIKRGVGVEPWIPTEPWDPSKTQNVFMVDYDYEGNDPIALCTDERILTIFKMYCLLDQNAEREIRPLFIDTTFELGPTFVTPVLTQHPEFEHRGNTQIGRREPIIPIAYLISKNKSKDEYRWLGDALKRNAGVADTDRVSAVITDDDPEMFGGLSECSLFDEPCCFILCGVNLQNNVKSVLEECRIEVEEVTKILGQIFGKEHQFSVDKGRIRRGDRAAKGLIDCHTVQEFDELLEEYEQYWDPTFYNWFVRYKVPYIRNRFFVSGNEEGTGWINANRIEAMKFHFMQSLESNYSEDNIVETLRKYTDSVVSKLEGAPFDIGDYQTKDETNRWAVKSNGVHFNDTPKTVRMARMAEFGLSRNPRETEHIAPMANFAMVLGSHLHRQQKLSLSLKDNLKMAAHGGSFASRVTQCERAAAKFIADDCVKQLKNKAQFAVEDVVASISAIFVVEKRTHGSFKCQFGFQVCEAYKMFKSCFCEHTVAVAEFTGQLRDHLDYVNENFPDASEETFEIPEPATSSGLKLPTVNIVKRMGQPKKVIEVVNPLYNEEEVKEVKPFVNVAASKRGPGRPSQKMVEILPPTVPHKPIGPTAEQLAELKAQKPLVYDEDPEHAYYNSNVFVLKQGAPPRAQGQDKVQVKCKKCKKPFVMPNQPGYVPPVDMHIVHYEHDVNVEANGDIVITEDEVPIYLHVKYSCIADRYPYFYPEGYLKCDEEDREKLGKAHQKELKTQFGVTLEEIGMNEME